MDDRTPHQPDAYLPDADEARQQTARSTPLPPARNDLQISPQIYLGETVYIVKDPVSLTYYRLAPAERMVLRHLDGQHSAAQIAEAVSQRHPDYELDADAVLKFFSMLQASGLILSRDAGHAGRLRDARRKKKKRFRRASAMNFLFIRVPLIDPDRALDRLYRHLAPLMHRRLLALALPFMAVSFIAALAGLWRAGGLAFPLLSWTNLALLSVVFFLVKVIHEFGHGLAAKHRGLEVHEMGVLFMVFLPMFYIDTSDAWVLPRRRDRLWINAGGVFIEFLFASAAVWVWLLTEPGWVNQAAFNIMLAASVTTLLFNANPLLRYDGYYFLMDLLQIPNLRSKAQQYVAHLARRFILAVREGEPPAEVSRRPVFMVVYSFAATVYRWLIVIGIIALVWHKLDDYGLEAIGMLMGIAAFTTMVLTPMYKALRATWRIQTATPRRLGVTAVVVAALAGVGWAVAMIPVERRVEQPAVVLADQRQPLFTPVGGEVAWVYDEVGDGSVSDELIEAGEPIVKLRDAELEDTARLLELDRDLAAVRLAKARDEGRPGAGEKLDVQRISEQLAHARRREAKLTVRAPFDCRLRASTSLATMLGSLVKPDQRLGTVIGVGGQHVVMLLPEADAALVEPGMEAELRLWANPETPIEGRVVAKAPRASRRFPHQSLSAAYGGEVGAEMDRERNEPIAAEPLLAVTIELADPDRNGLPRLMDGMTGQGRIIIGRGRFGPEQWRKLQNAVSLDWWL